MRKKNSSAPESPPHIPKDIAAEMRIGIVVARFNTAITERMLAICDQQLRTLGVLEDHIDIFHVPGALEIPVVMDGLAQTGGFDALIAIGCVIRGETYHFELVANESARGLSQVALEYGVPTINAILTVENEAQAQARIQEKSLDAASGAVEMALLGLSLQYMQMQAQEEHERETQQ